MLARLLLTTAMPAVLLAQLTSTFPPHSGFEPPAAETAASITGSTKAAPRDLLTVAEASNFKETGRYAESLALYSKFVAASPLARLVTLGRTPEGRDIVMLIVSKDKAFTPEAAAKTGKTVVLIQNGVDGGDTAGKDATAMLLRDMLVTKRLASLLDSVIVLSIPVLNVDGHERFSPYNRINQNGPKEMGWRATSQRINLNRDYMKADAPEMRAWLAMYTNWLPDLLIDNHVSDGGDHQYDITYAMATGPEVAPSVADWSRDKFLPKLLADIESDGHVVAPYGDFDTSTSTYKGSTFSPRFSNGYAAIQNRAGLLVETHNLKSFKTRVWAHYDIMRHALQLVGGLHTAVAQADKDVTAMAGSEINVHLNGAIGREGVAFDYKGVGQQQQQSPLTRGFYTVYFETPINTSTMLYDQVETTASAQVPVAYVIPRQWTALINLLRLHGVQTDPLDRNQQLATTATRLLDPQWSDRPVEGHHRVEFRVERHDEPRTFPEGSVVVRMHQRAARVALNLLEPEAPDSAVQWGMLDPIFEQKETVDPYILEPLALTMEMEHDDLRMAYQKRLREDAMFASDPKAKLRWWYERSPYTEKDLYLYPVFKLAKAPAKTAPPPGSPRQQSALDRP